jgi:hypothetical protein
MYEAVSEAVSPYSFFQNRLASPRNLLMKLFKKKTASLAVPNGALNLHYHDPELP